MPSVVTKASINMYADDTTLYASHSNAITAAKVVSDDLAKIHNWCFENSLIINSKKTYAYKLIFCSNVKMPLSYWMDLPLNQFLRFATWESILIWLFLLKIT